MPTLIGAQCTTASDVSGQVDALLSRSFGAAPAKRVAESLPQMYQSTVVLYFADVLPAGEEWLREFTQIFGAASARVHNAVAVAGPTCSSSLFVSSAGPQQLNEHRLLLGLLEGEMEALLGQHVPAGTL